MQFIINEKELLIRLEWKRLRGAVHGIVALLKALIPLITTIAALAATGTLYGWW